MKMKKVEKRQKISHCKKRREKSSIDLLGFAFQSQKQCVKAMELNMKMPLDVEIISEKSGPGKKKKSIFASLFYGEKNGPEQKANRIQPLDEIEILPPLEGENCEPVKRSIRDMKYVEKNSASIFARFQSEPNENLLLAPFNENIRQVFRIDSETGKIFSKAQQSYLSYQILLTTNIGENTAEDESGVD
eukprot:Sdes_comp16290_c0_seq1m5640